MVLGLVFHRWNNVQFVLLDIALVMVVALVFGRLAKRLGQPAVVGEVIAGISLGPSLLGHLSTSLFPLASRPTLQLLSTLGVVVFMFIVGLELDWGHLQRKRRQTAAGVALLGTLLPFLLGLLLAVPLYQSRHHPHFWPFALFIGVSMSITAVPVLARLLIEKDLYATPLGVVTMASAALDDVLTWITLAFVLAVVSSGSNLELPYTIVVAGVFTVVMVRLVQPRLRPLADRDLDPTTLSLLVAGVLLAAFATAAMGLHEIFGAFLAGAIFPRGRLADQLRERLDAVALILLPLFFVVTGLSVQLRGITGSDLGRLGLILLVACSGKFLGGLIGARTSGLGPRESVAMGVLMNTRGLTELVVLTVGLQAGVIDTKLFSLLVVMAVVTTVATGPLLGLVKPDPSLGAGAADGAAGR